MTYQIPDPRFEVPDLLTPNKKPVTQVEIDWSHADTEGLVFLAYPDTHSIELVNGLKGEQSGCKNEGSATGLHLLQDTTTDSQWYENRIASEIDAQVTIIFGGSIDSSDSYGNLVSIPYRNDATWSKPWFSLAIQRDSTTTSARFAYAANSATLSTISSDTGFISIDGSYHQYAVTRIGTSVWFYKDGVRYGAEKGIVAATIDFGDNAPVHIGARNHLTTGEDITGTMEHVAIYNRELSKEEMLRWHRNSTRFLIPK